MKQPEIKKRKYLRHVSSPFHVFVDFSVLLHFHYLDLTNVSINFIVQRVPRGRLMLLSPKVVFIVKMYEKFKYASVTILNVKLPFEKLL